MYSWKSISNPFHSCFATLRITVVIFVFLSVCPTVYAHDTSGRLYFTQAGSGPQIGYLDYRYNGTSFDIININLFADTPEGDGIAGNPKDKDKLIVGGGNLESLYNVSKSTGAVETFNASGLMFHLEISDSSTVYGAGLPGRFTRHTINDDGSIDPNGVVIDQVTGDDIYFTTLITTPEGYFYTSGPPNCCGSYGKIEFTGGNTAVSTRLHDNLVSAHGASYDPLTNSVIIFGREMVTQLDLEGNIIAELDVSHLSEHPMQLDQGTVDGNGHLFVASNTGPLLFIDYSETGLIDDPANFAVAPYVMQGIDDVAPLVGSGSTNQSVIALDIHPTSCPNPINLKSGGLVPVAILGSSNLDVSQIDISTITLEGVAPRRTALEDVATPYLPLLGRADKLDCTTLGKDGIEDLTLKFDNKALSAKLGDAADGDVRVLTINGAMVDGATITGEDVVVIIKK